MTRMSADDPILSLRSALAGRAPRRAEPDPSIAEAAVLLTLRRSDPLELLVIRRAEKEGDPWSGHMALPGGRRQPEDADLMRTALRETAEETGLVIAPESVLGELDWIDQGARRRFAIVVAPFVAVVDPDVSVVPEPSEVDAALWVPLSHLASEEAVDEFLIEIEGEARTFPALSYQEHVIWGLTHRILTGFMRLAGRAGLV